MYGVFRTSVRIRLRLKASSHISESPSMQTCVKLRNCVLVDLFIANYVIVNR